MSICAYMLYYYNFARWSIPPPPWVRFASHRSARSLHHIACRTSHHHARLLASSSYLLPTYLAADEEESLSTYFASMLVNAPCATKEEEKERLFITLNITSTCNTLIHNADMNTCRIITQNIRTFRPIFLHSSRLTMIGSLCPVIPSITEDYPIFEPYLE